MRDVRMTDQEFVLSGLVCAKRMRLFDELRSVIVAETSQRVIDSFDFTALLFAPEVFALGSAFKHACVHVED
jgi:hypothetical protein